MGKRLGVLMLVVMVSALLGPHTAMPVHAASETWTVTSAISIGCASSATGFNVAYSNIDPAKDYYQETWVTDGVNVYMDEYIGPTTPFDTTWYLYNANDRGLQTALFPIPSPVTVRLRLYNASHQPIYETRLTLYCSGGSYTVDYSGPAGVPGCDVSIPIPSDAVVGAFVADAPLYWAPGQLTDPVVTIPAGNTAWVLGKDQSGAYYKIAWVCDLLWVPVETMGPNFDEVWNGTPLPTGVVQ